MLIVNRQSLSFTSRCQSRNSALAKALPASFCVSSVQPVLAPVDRFEMEEEDGDDDSDGEPKPKKQKSRGKAGDAEKKPRKPSKPVRFALSPRH